MKTTSPLGQVIDARTLRMERVLPAPIDKVWGFLIDPAKRARWLAGGGDATQADTVIDLRFENDSLSGETPPEKYKSHGGVHVQKSRVLKVQAPRLLVMTWQEGSAHASEVSFELSARGNETHLSLVHSKLPRREDLLNVAGGWHAHLDVLEDVLAERSPRPFWSNFVEKEAVYDKLIPAG